MVNYLANYKICVRKYC